MKTEVEAAIKKLATDVTENNHKPHELMQLAQAAISFGHVLSILHHNEKDK